MEGAQCFIEVWKGRYSDLYNSPIRNITTLNDVLKHTERIGLKTIAVWYIKPKQKSL